MADDYTQDQLDKAIEKAVEKATGKFTTSLEKLKTKNTELVTELQTARKKNADFEGFDPAEVKLALENAKAGERKALEDKGEYEKALKLANEQHATTVKDLTEKLEAASSGEKKLRTRTAIDNAMDEIKVAPGFKSAVRALHKSKISIIDQDGKPTAMVGDKSVTDYFKNWAETDEGKNFVGDNGAGGGGAGGGGNQGGGENPYAKDTRNLSLQGIMERDHPAKAAQLKKQAGVSA